MVPKGKTSTKGRNGGGKRHGGRVVLSLDVEAHVRDALRKRAALSGVSMAEYLCNAIAQPERSYATVTTEIAQPLVQVSYRIAQAADALKRGDVGAATSELHAAKQIVSSALVPLRRGHDDEVRASERRRGGGWNG
jgi:hypothetical protein